MRLSSLWIVTLVVAGSLVGSFGCQKDASPEAKPAAEKAAVPADFALATAPKDAVDLASLKTSDVKDGGLVTVRAVVGGSAEPFTANRAVVQVIDPSVTTCDKMPGDSCATPWDACCAQPDVKAKGGILQVAAADGQPVKGTLQGVAGLAPLKEVLVQGTVRFEGQDRTPVINATHVWAKP